MHITKTLINGRMVRRLECDEIVQMGDYYIHDGNLHPVFYLGETAGRTPKRPLLNHVDSWQHAQTY